MANAAAQLLDQLMGTARNAVPGDNVRELSWSDDEVCKYNLCGFCPSDLFINTKAEASVGPCYKVHDEHLKRLYEESDDSDRRGYEDTFLSYLERLVRDLDKKVDRGKDRLRRSAEAKQESLCGRGPGGQSSERLKQLSQDIDELVLELQLLGDMGRVEETHNLMVKLEEMEREREAERMTLTCNIPKVLAGFELDANDFHEKMELCDVCGSFLVIGDTQSRVDAHLLGKQHLGFARIRTTIAELKLKKEMRFKAKQEELANRRLQEREQGSRYRRNSHHSHSKDRRTSHRSSSRERASRQSSHRRKRHSIKSRSSSRDKRRRSRSWSRNRRSTSKSRSRSRGRKIVRSRSRNRRKSRTKSRDRRRSRSKSRDRRRSLSKSRDRRRSRSKSRDRRRSQSKSKDRRRSRSKSRDRRRSQSKSWDRRMSRSKSREKYRSSKKIDEKKAEGCAQEILSSRSRSKEEPKDSRTGPNGNN